MLFKLQWSGLRKLKYPVVRVIAFYNWTLFTNTFLILIKSTFYQSFFDFPQFVGYTVSNEIKTEEQYGRKTSKISSGSRRCISP